MVGHSWRGESFADVVRDARTHPDFIVSYDLLISHDSWRDTSDEYAQQYYALAALFTGYLIAKYGKEKYLELYRSLARDATQSENKKQYEEILRITPEDLWAQLSVR